jgi:hypothetical protein
MAKRANSKYQYFVNLTEELRKLRVQENIKNIPIEEKYVYFNQAIDDLLKSRDEVIPIRLAELKNLINASPEKLKISTFELMVQSRLENTHSNILEYLFDYSLLGSEAADILSDMFSHINDGNNYGKIKESILRKKYFIKREKLVKVGNKRGHIDLFIFDEINKFTITIENKIHAGIASFEQEEKDDAKSQLDLYYKYVSKKYKRYNNYFMLLTFQPLEIDVASFQLVELKDMYEILMKYNVDDNILKEYKLMLFAMIRGLDVGRLSHIRQIKNINDQNMPNLNSIELLKGLYSEI